MNVLELAKYPFLDKAREYASGFFDVPLSELGAETYERVWDRAVSRVLDAISDRQVHQDASDLFDYRTEILSFPLAVVLVAFIGDDRLREIFSLAEARRARRHLDNEAADYTVELARQVGIIAGAQDNGLFNISVFSYLKLASSFRGAPKWKLANRNANHGRVTLQSSEFKRLVQEAIKGTVFEKTLRKVSQADLPQRYTRSVQLVKEEWAKETETRFRPQGIPSGAVPPCMSRLRTRMKKGESLSHFERLVLATYLINIGKSVEDMLEIFSCSPDFDVKTARYQIEHLAGIRGSKTRYTTPSCDALRKNSLCFPDAGCEGIRNPLNYRGVAAAQ